MLFKDYLFVYFYFVSLSLYSAAEAEAEAAAGKRVWLAAWNLYVYIRSLSTRLGTLPSVWQWM